MLAVDGGRRSSSFTQPAACAVDSCKRTLQAGALEGRECVSRKAASDGRGTRCPERDSLAPEEDRRAFLDRPLATIRKFTDEKAKGYRFSEEEFMSLPQSSITTSTTWTTRSRFDGPLLAKLAPEHIGASGSRLDVQALGNGTYSASIPMSDLQAFSPILAHSRDGKRMTARDHGPLFVMYPRDKYPSKSTHHRRRPSSSGR